MYSSWNMPMQTTSLGNYLTSRKSPVGLYKPVLQRFNQVTKSGQIFINRQKVYPWHNHQSIIFKFSVPNHKALVLFKVKVIRIFPLLYSPKSWLTWETLFQVAKICQYGHTIKTDSITNFTYANKNLNFMIQRKKKIDIR